MTHQAISLGIPSFQLEIPRSVRKLLGRDDKLMEKFATHLYDFYQNTICKMWKDYELTLFQEPYIFDDIVNLYEDADTSLLKKLSKEYQLWEKVVDDKVI